MSRKLIALIVTAGFLLGTSKSLALTCAQDNKVSMNPDTQCCCCKEDTTNHFACKPMNDKGDKKCPGVQAAAGDDLYKTKISTQANNTCVCEFTKR